MKSKKKYFQPLRKIFQSIFKNPRMKNFESYFFYSTRLENNGNEIYLKKEKKKKKKKKGSFGSVYIHFRRRLDSRKEGETETEETLSAGAISARKRDGRRKKPPSRQLSILSRRSYPYKGLARATPKSRENICSGCPPPSVFGSLENFAAVMRTTAPRVENSIKNLSSGRSGNFQHDIEFPSISTIK